MSINKSYAVFGLGRYGMAVAEELMKNGAEGLDSDPLRRVAVPAVVVSR